LKNIFTQYRWWLTAALMASLSTSNASDRGPASDWSRQQTAFEKNLPRALAALNAAGDADSLAMAAEFSDTGKEGQAPRLALLARAAALAPDRADLVWLEIEACSHTDDCDATPFAQTLTKLDPDNGAAWAPLIDRATKLKNVEALRRYLAAMGESKRFDIYWTTSIAHLTHALLKVKVYDARTALIGVIGVEAATAMPAFKNILNACKGAALLDADRFKACQGIASALRNGDTFITEMLGAGLAKRIWPEGSAQYNDAVRARRVALYRLDSLRHIGWANLDHNRDANEYLKLAGGHASEQEMDEEILTRAGKSTVPPDDWKETVPGGA
jgi:hypothetical protein